MESFDLDPTARVFHVDTECYVIYIGTEPDDYRPFLRIGNSDHLPSNVTEYINPIVVTDTMTGNPLLESANLGANSAVENRYIGDPKTVERLKDFVGRQSVSTEGFEYYHGDIADVSGVYVYFYADGNVTVKYGKSELFNLRRREQRDRHYLERARQVKNSFERNPLKYPRETFNGRGFLFLERNLAVFNKGEIGLTGLWDDYFVDMALTGIDPDKVASAVVESPNLGLLRLAKRSKVKATNLKVFSRTPGPPDRFLDLFASSDQSALSYTVTELKAKASQGLAGHQVSTADGGLLLARRGAAYTLAVGGSASDAQLSLDPEHGAVGFGGASLRIAPGVPCLIHETKPKQEDLFRQYLPSKTTNLRELVGNDGHGAITNLVAFVDEIRQGRDGSKFYKAARSSLRAMSEKSDIVTCYALNVTALCAFLSTIDDYAPMARQLKNAADQLQGDVGLLDTVDYALPVVCDLFVYDDALLSFYRFTALLSTTKLEQARNAQQRIRAALAVETDFEAERNRLLSLVSGLADPEVQLQKLMTKIAEEKERQEKDQAAETEPETQPERKKASQPDKAERKTTSANRPEKPGTGRGTGATQARPSTAESIRRAAAPRAGSRPRRSRRGPWIAAAAVLGVLLIAVALWLLGLVPGGLLTRTDPAAGSPDGLPTSEVAVGPGPAESEDDRGDQESDLAEQGEDAVPEDKTEAVPSGQQGDQEPIVEAGESGDGLAQPDEQVPPDSDDGRESAAGEGPTSTADGTAAEAAGEREAETGPPSSQTEQEARGPDRGDDEPGVESPGDGAEGTDTVAERPEVDGVEGEAPDVATTTPEPGVAAASEEETDAAESAEAEAETTEESASERPGGDQPDRVPQPSRPMTEEEARATTAFSGAGGIEASVFDIIEMVNRIAVSNGYRRMDSFDSDAPDPDWIYPGNVFVLPDGTRYTVEKNDTLWDIAVRFMRAQLRDHYRRYQELLDELNTNPGKSDDIADSLEDLAEEAYVDEFRRLVDRKVAELQ
jgi:hypothetical protein